MVTAVITGQIRVSVVLNIEQIYLEMFFPCEILCLSLDDPAACYALGAISGICHGKICK